MSRPAAAFLVVLILATLACIQRPRYSDWDMAAYMALVRQDHNPATVYAELKRSMPSEDYQVLIGAGNVQEGVPPDAWRQDMASNPDHFLQMMPFYAVKPLYIVIVRLLWKIGSPLFFAMHIVSAIAFFMTGWIVWLWLTKHLFGWVTFIAASTLVLQPFLLQQARAPLPDALGTSLLVAGAYFIWERDRKAIGAGFLLLSILARPDALIFCVLFFASLRMFVPMVSAVAIYLTNNYFVNSYGWTKLFYHSFVHSLLDPKDAVVNVGPRVYFSVLATNTQHLVFNDTLLLLVLALGIWVMVVHRDLRKYVLLCMATIALHQLAFPTLSDADRYYAPEYLLILLIAASAILGRRSTGQGSQERSA